MRLNTHPGGGQSGLYQFLSDPGAGAIGNIGLDVVIPANAIITHFSSCMITQLVGVGASISFGWFDPTGVVPQNTVGFVGLNPIGAFVLGAPTDNLFMTLFPAKFPVPVTVTMSIVGAPLTAGDMQFIVDYNENDV